MRLRLETRSRDLSWEAVFRVPVIGCMLWGLRNESDKEGSSAFPSSTIRMKGSSWAPVLVRGGFAFCLARWRTSLVAQLLKNLPAVQETWVWSLGWEDPLEKGKATLSSILTWRIPWEFQSMGLQSQTQLSDFHFHCSKVEGRLKDSTPPSPKAKRCCSRTQLLHRLREFAFITQLQLGNGQDRLNSLQFSVYVMNELRSEALFYQGQVLGHSLRQEEDDTCAPSQGQLGNLKQQRGSTWVRCLEPRSLAMGKHP